MTIVATTATPSSHTQVLLPVTKPGGIAQFLLMLQIPMLVLSGLSSSCGNFSDVEEGTSVSATENGTLTSISASSAPRDSRHDTRHSTCAPFARALCEALGPTTGRCDAAKKTVELMSPATCRAGLDNIAFTQEIVTREGAVCSSLMHRLCRDIGEDTDSCEMVRSQTPDFSQSTCENMLTTYETVLAGLQEREAFLKPLSIEQQQSIGGAFKNILGPRDARVTVVEFTDFQCEPCKTVSRALSLVSKRYEGKSVKLVSRQFPMTLNKHAHLAAQAVLAAGDQGRFWAFHDALFVNQGGLSRDGLETTARELGLNIPKFRRALSRGAYSRTVDEEKKLGSLVGVDSAPAILVNGRRVLVPSSPDAIAELIDEELGKSN